MLKRLKKIKNKKHSSRQSTFIGLVDYEYKKSQEEKIYQKHLRGILKFKVEQKEHKNEFFNYNTAHPIVNQIVRSQKIFMDKLEYERQKHKEEKKKMKLLSQQAILAEISKNTKIIQPAYMKNKGSMCTTELWSIKDKCEYKFMMKGEVQQLQIPYSLEELGSLYRPKKIQQNRFIKDKMEKLKNEQEHINQKIKKQVFNTLENKKKEKIQEQEAAEDIKLFEQKLYYQFEQDKLQMEKEKEKIRQLQLDLQNQAKEQNDKKLEKELSENLYVNFAKSPDLQSKQLQFNEEENQKSISREELQQLLFQKQKALLSTKGQLTQNKQRPIQFYKNELDSLKLVSKGNSLLDKINSLTDLYGIKFSFENKRETDVAAFKFLTDKRINQRREMILDEMSRIQSEEKYQQYDQMTKSLVSLPQLRRDRQRTLTMGNNQLQQLKFQLNKSSKLKKNKTLILGKNIKLFPQSTINIYGKKFNL